MILFYFLVWIMPLSRHPLWGKVIGDLTIFKYLGGACLLYAVLHLVSRRTLPPFFHTWQARLFCLLVLIATVSYFTKTLPPNWEFSPFSSYLSFLLLFFVTLTVVDSLPRLRWALLVSIGSVAFASLYVIREWQKYQALNPRFRPGWVVGDPNYFTLSAILCLPIAFYMMLERRSRFERLFCLGCLVVTLVAVTLGASRGGALGLASAFLFAVLRSSHRVRNLALVTVMLVPLSIVAPSSPLHRFLQPDIATEEAVTARKVAWNAGLRMIEAHPLTGIGLANFRSLMPRYADPGANVDTIAHNTYIEMAAETGLPSLLIFLAMLFAGFRTLERVRRRALHAGPPLLYQAALGMQSGLLGYAVANMFVSGQYQKLFWLMVFLSMCLPALLPAGGREEKDLISGNAFRGDSARGATQSEEGQVFSEFQASEN